MARCNNIRLPLAALMLVRRGVVTADACRHTGGARSRIHGAGGRSRESRAGTGTVHGRAWTRVELLVVPWRGAHATGQSRGDRQADCGVGAGVQRRTLHRRARNREVVPPQLQRRHGPRVHRGREGRRAELAENAQAMMDLRTFPFRAALAFAAVLVCGHAAHADDDLRGLARALAAEISARSARPAMWRTRPGMLPADSWQRLMNNLPRHFGTDASLDAASVKELSAWLTANAGIYKRVREAPPQDRITSSAWFTRTARGGVGGCLEAAGHQEPCQLQRLPCAGRPRRFQ